MAHGHVFLVIILVLFVSLVLAMRFAQCKFKSSFRQFNFFCTTSTAIWFPFLLMIFIFSFKSVPMIMLSHLRRRTRDYYGPFHTSWLSASASALRERKNPRLSCACDTRWTLLPVLHTAIRRPLRLSPLQHKRINQHWISSIESMIEKYMR